MYRHRTVIALLLCLAIPVQGYAALRMAAGDCPAMGTKQSQTGVGAYSDGHGMSCCEHGGDKSAPVKGCDSCPECTLLTAIAPPVRFVSPSFSRDIPAPGFQEAPPASGQLFAIWRPPTLL